MIDQHPTDNRVARFDSCMSSTYEWTTMCKEWEGGVIVRSEDGQTEGEDYDSRTVSNEYGNSHPACITGFIEGMGYHSS